MSHPDPLYDPENSYEDDDMSLEHDPSDALLAEYLYDDHDDFFDEDSSNYHPDAAYEISTHIDDEEDEEFWDDTIDDSMDGDAESAFGSCGWGVDEQYGYYGEDF